MRKRLLAAVALASVAWTSAGHATPVSYQIYDGAALIGSGSSLTGDISLSGLSSRFRVSGEAVTEPALTSPDMSTNTFTVHSSQSGTLTIRITDTDLTSFSGTVKNTFALNSLNGDSFQSATIANYFDASNTAYGTGTQLASVTYNGKQSFADSIDTGLLSFIGPFSETTIYTLIFGGSSKSGTVSASSQLAATVPEPASMALLGTGLLAFGLVRRQRKA